MNATPRHTLTYDEPQDEYVILHGLGTMEVTVWCFTRAGEPVMPDIEVQSPDVVKVDPFVLVMNRETGEMDTVRLDITKIVIIG